MCSQGKQLKGVNMHTRGCKGVQSGKSGAYSHNHHTPRAPKKDHLKFIWFIVTAMVSVKAHGGSTAHQTYEIPYKG